MKIDYYVARNGLSHVWQVMQCKWPSTGDPDISAFVSCDKEKDASLICYLLNQHACQVPQQS